MQISFLGLGAMGRRMAQRLLAVTDSLTVWNRSAAATAPFAGQARVAADVASAVAEADVVCVMVTDDEASAAIWDAALPAVRAGAILLECSTVTPDWIARLEARVSAQGATLVDAPVVGTLPHAEGGALTCLVGGPAAAVARIEPILAAWGTARHLGAAGRGAAAKLMVNAWFAAQVALLDEVLGVAAPQLERAEAMGLLASLPVTAPALQAMGGLMIAGDDAPRFPIDLVVKDLRYAAARQPTAVIGAALARFSIASAQGRGGLNITAVGER